MRSLKKFIAESVHTYDYTIKVAGDVDKNFLELFKYNLDKFSPVDIKGPTSTPIQKDPYGFPNLNNEPVHIFTCKFAYPCTEPMVQQMGQLLGHNINYIRMVETNYNDSITKELEQYENQASPALGEPELEDNGKDASKEYGDKYLDSIHKKSIEKDEQKVGLPVDQKNTKDAFDPWKPWTDDQQGGNKSPMTDIKRGAKPETSAGL